MFLVFAFDSHDSRGGFSDCILKCNSLEDAIKYICEKYNLDPVTLKGKTNPSYPDHDYLLENYQIASVEQAKIIKYFVKTNENNLVDWTEEYQDLCKMVGPTIYN